MARRTATAARTAPSTRDRMVAGAVDLLRRRGVKATSLREVVRHTQTPRGSLAHHFPDGKAQLLEEAVDYARRHVTRQLGHALEEHGTVGGLRVFMRQWRAMLESTGFEAGCPIMAVAVERDDELAADDTCGEQRLLDGAQEAFHEWSTLIAAALRHEGLAAGPARSLATLILAAFEGAIGMCRAARSTGPLDDVERQLGAMLKGALADQGAPRRRRVRRS